MRQSRGVPVLSLLTDFGTRDGYVGALKGTVLRLAPGTQLVDLSHEIAPGDVETAAYLLAYAAPSFPAGSVHLAVVDPGVGSKRRLIALETPFGILLAPDNGLLSPLLDRGETRWIRREDLFLTSPDQSHQNQTFHGRDRLAPVAAFLLQGGAFAALGPRIDDARRLEIRPPTRDGDRITGRIAHIDHYGNLISDIPTEWIDGRAIEITVEHEGGPHRARRRVSHYAELGAHEAGVLPGSRGTLEIAANGHSLARAWGVSRGAQIELRLLPPSS